MADWQQLRRFLALLCALAVVLAAVIPGSGGILLAVIGPICALALLIHCAPRRAGVEPVRLVVSVFLTACPDRAPPV
jgi:hypothetical protein